MSQLDEQHKVDEMRRRLYSRGAHYNEERHNVSDIKVDVSRNWNYHGPQNDEETPAAPVAKKSRRYRIYILLGSFLILLLTMAGTGAYLFYGGNEISSENITIDINAPTTLDGGARLAAMIAVTNQNNVTIEDATLIVSYPEGSQTTGEPRDTLFEQRIAVDRLEPGEARNVPVEAIIYGEEGQIKQLAAQLEYSIENSDNMFYKDADPSSFRIISSPIILQVGSVRRVASGQEVEVDIVVTSNSSETFDNLLITASYPEGFTYESASPEPTFGQNVWRIRDLAPEESSSVTVRGNVQGLAEQVLRLNVEVGPALPDNQFIAGATLIDSYTEFEIERPFISVVTSVNGSTDSPIVLQAGDMADISIDIINTLTEPVYDMVIEVIPRGDVIRTAEVNGGNGFYDSNAGVIRYEGSNIAGLRELQAGDSQTLLMSISPRSTGSTASFMLDVSVFGKRVGEVAAQEQLFGTEQVEVRYVSEISASNAVAHVSGPIPPVVGEETVYQVSLVATAGNNDVTNGVMSALLPLYVEWLGNYQAEGPVSYNPVTRELRWEVGSISGAQEKTLRFTVATTPSLSQAGRSPIIVNQQVFEAVDRFTGTPLRVTVPQLTTTLSANGAVEEGSGMVQRSQ